MTVPLLNLRYKILLPVGLVIGLICFGGFLSTYSLQKNHLDEMISSRIKNTGYLFNIMLDVEADTLQGLAEAYSKNEHLQKAFMAVDRNSLFMASKKIFSDVRAKYNITHFYFHLPDKSCFLRVHDPSRHSDQINRHTIRQASLQISPSRGFELGPLGTLTLRVVTPWFIKDELVGYIELGKEIDHVIPRLKKIQDVEMIFAVNKKYLTRDLWEEGLQVMGKTGNWDTFEEHIVTSTTFETLPTGLDSILGDHENYHNKDLFDLKREDFNFRVGPIPLIDAGGTEVGDIFVLRDLDEVSYSQKAFVFLVVVTLILIVTSYLLFSFYLGNIDKNIQEYQNKLKKEIEDHEVTEKQLAEHQKQLDELVLKKTGELEEAMAEVKILSGFLPICASCKSIRTEEGEWEQIESYIRDHSEAEFSHSYCPKCAQKLYSDFRK